MKNEHIHNQNHSINLDADGPYRRVLSGLAIWFRWLGRLAAPLFFYALAVGFRHTRNRKKYLLRLYLANVGMVFFNQIMCMLQRKLDYVAYQPKNHNIFTTCFVRECLSVYGKAGKRRKSFLHTLEYISSGRLW